jgi:aryl-alcohol dehydrogenase-like predicted oxidoreductase
MTGAGTTDSVESRCGGDDTRSDGRESGRVSVPAIGKLTSRVGFGTGGLLRIGSARLRQDILAAALASGITHFDTAPIYGFGESERALGRFLGGQRHRATLTTKFGLQPSRLAARLAPLQRAGRRALQIVPALRRVAVRSAGALYAPPHFDVAAVRSSLEHSLRALRTDYVDFFLAHQASIQALPGEEIVELLEDLRRAGKILAFGVATDFEHLIPVLSQRPKLSAVMQFDNELTTGNIAAMNAAADQLVITYGFINRSIAACREKLRNTTAPRGDLDRADDETLGGLLLRATVLANPRGIVLMQSRAIARIERNVRAANSDQDDERVHGLVKLLGPKQ